MKNSTFAVLVILLIIACTNGHPRPAEKKDSTISGTIGSGITITGTGKHDSISAAVIDSASGDTLQLKSGAVISVGIWYVDSDGTTKPLKQGGTIPPAPGTRHEYYFNGKEWSEEYPGFFSYLFHSTKVSIYTFTDPGKKEPSYFTIYPYDCSDEKFRLLKDFLRDEEYFGSGGESGTTSGGKLVAFDISMLKGSFQMLKQRIDEFFNKKDSKTL